MMAEKDDTVEVGFQANTTQLKQGTAEATAAVENATKKMSASMDKLTDSTKKFSEADIALAKSLGVMKDKLIYTQDTMERLITKAKALQAEKQKLAEATASASTATASSASATDKASGAFAMLGRVAGSVGGLVGGLVLTSLVSLTTYLAVNAVPTFKEFNATMTSMIQRLGVGATQAAALDRAMKMLGGSGEDYTDAFVHFSRALKSNSEELKHLGIDVDGFNKGQRTSTELFEQAIKVVKEHKAGLDQTLASLTLFGRGVDGIGKLMKLSKEDIAKATEETAKFGLVMTKTDQEMDAGYKKSLAELKAGKEALSMVVARTLIPIFNAMVSTFTGGTWAITVLRGAMFLLGSVLNAVTIAVQLLYYAFRTLFTLDFKKGFEDIKGAVTSLGQRMKTLHADTIGFDPKKVKESEALPIGGTKAYTPMPKKEAEKSNMQQYEEELARLRESYERDKLETEGSFQQFSLSMEKEFWQKKLAIVKIGTEDYTRIQSRVYQINRQMRIAAFEAEIAEIRTQITKLRYAEQEKLLKYNEIQGKMEQGYGPKSKEAEAAARDTEMQRQRVFDQMNQLEEQALARSEATAQHKLELDKVNAEQELALGRITKSRYIEMEEGFELERVKMALKYATARLQIAEMSENPTAVAAARAKVEQVEQEHQRRMVQLRKEAAIESGRFETMRLQGVENAMESLVDNLISLNKSFKDILISFARDIESVFRKTAAKEIAEAIFGKGGAAAGATKGGGSSIMSFFSSIGSSVTSSVSSFLGGLFGGGRAMGGPTEAGKVYKVGEMGPEYLMMGAPGYVFPGGSLAGGMQVVNHFHVASPNDMRSQGQIAAAAGAGISRAARRLT